MPTVENETESWTIPPELDQPLPRRVRLSGTGVFNCVFAAASIIAGMAIANQAVQGELRREAEAQARTRQVSAEGRETDATVTRLTSGLGIDSVGYDFTVDGRTYSGYGVMAPSHWAALQVGSPLEILYLPSDPAKSYPESDPPNSQTHWLLVLPVAGMALFFMFSFAAIQLSAVLPKRRLLARGRPARAVVTRCNAGSRGRSSGYFLHYDFSLPDGSKSQGKVFRSEPVTEGSTATALYDPDHPQRNTLYPLAMVKLTAA
jgi:hypothetical protein